MENSKKNIIRIVTVVAIVAVIAGIYLIKTIPDQSSAAADVTYPLEVSAVDMDELKESHLPIVIDFGATECIPCKEMAPVLLKLNEEMQGEARIHFVDVWVNPDASRGYPVQLIPTQLFINADGTPYVPSGDLGIELKAYADNETGEHIYTVHEGGLSEAELRLILEDMGA